jgi:hypothetical protein
MEKINNNMMPPKSSQPEAIPFRRDPCQENATAELDGTSMVGILEGSKLLVAGDSDSPGKRPAGGRLKPKDGLVGQAFSPDLQVDPRT